MNTTFSPRHSRLMRAVSAGIIFFMTFPSSFATWAALTDLSDYPLQTMATAAPNLLYTMDDSTSMASDYTPEYIIGNYCRNYEAPTINTTLPSSIANYLRVDGHYPVSSGIACGQVVNGANLGYAKTTTRGMTISSANKQIINTADANRIAHPPVMNSAFNRLFYDPLIEYEAPYKPQNLKERYPDIDGVLDLDWTRVPSDQYWSASPQYFNLRDDGRAYAYLYCNSDWNPSVVYDKDKKEFTSFDPNECRYNAEAYTQNGPAGTLTAPAVVADDQYPADYGWGDARNFRYRPLQYLYCDKSKFLTADKGGTPQKCEPKRSDGVTMTPDSSNNLPDLSNWSAILGNEDKTNYTDSDSCSCTRTSGATVTSTQRWYGECTRTVGEGCGRYVYDCQLRRWYCKKPDTLAYDNCSREDAPTYSWACKREEYRVHALGGVSEADYEWDDVSKQYKLKLTAEQLADRLGDSTGGEAGSGVKICMEGMTVTKENVASCTGGSAEAQAACTAKGFTCPPPRAVAGASTWEYSQANRDARTKEGYACAEQTPSTSNDLPYSSVASYTASGYTCKRNDVPQACPYSDVDQCRSAGYSCSTEFESGRTYTQKCDRNTNGLGGDCPGGIIPGGWACKNEDNKEPTETINPAKWNKNNCYRNVINTCDARYVADANGAGNICRHNRGTYAQAANSASINTTGGGMLASFATSTYADDHQYASRVSSYPYTTQVNCQPTGTPNATYVPLHYYRTKLTWCAKADTTGRRTGLGDGKGCADDKSAARPYPYFSNVLGIDGGDVFTKVTLDIKNKKVNGRDTITHQYLDEKGNIKDKVTRTFKQEMTNYGNWFAYYRTRALAARTVTSLAFFDAVKDDKDMYVGFQALNYDGKNNAKVAFPDSLDGFLPVGKFPANRGDFLKKVFSPVLVAEKVTPTINAMNRAGMYFKNGGGFSKASDPIIASCQKNFHVLFTDGATEQGPPENLPSETGDFDKTVLNYSWLKDDFGDPLKVFGVPLVSGQHWPYPIRDDLGTSGSLADLALYYWATDLRPGNGLKEKNNVPTSSEDPATWQHVNFSAMAMGVEGTLTPTGSRAMYEALAAGDQKWPKISTPRNPGALAIDDLWHATINGFGRFANTQSPKELMKALAEILADVQSASGTRAADSYQGFDMTDVNDAFVYRVSFLPGWSGDVLKTEVDADGLMTTKDEWSAQEKLTARLTPGAAPKDKPWNTNRYVFTRKNGNLKVSGGTGIPFRFDDLSLTQKNALVPPRLGEKSKDDMQRAVVDFLRGSNEFENDDDSGFRKRNKEGSMARSNPLGDIVNARAVFVGSEHAIKYDPSRHPGYAAFKAATADRKGAVYAAANDGMLHAFNAENGSGEEFWAYVPSELFRPYVAPKDVVAEKDLPGLVHLTLPNIGNPSFNHYYYVDATPQVMDADLGGGKWATLLVGGLGKGGKAYYALDVSRPEISGAILAESARTIEKNIGEEKSLWEFNNDQAKGKLGYTYGRAVIVKLEVGKKGAKKEEWKVIVPSGYNNTEGEAGDGRGYIFILNAGTGELEATMTTGSGSKGSPSGLAHIAGFSRLESDQLAKEIYGGDLNGDFWRFDLSNIETIKDLDGRRAEHLAQFKNQPITTEPRIEIDVFDGTEDMKRWVFVGTGRMLGEEDIEDWSKQTFYAFLDGTQDAPQPIDASYPIKRGDLVEVGSADDATGVEIGGKKGWYIDLGDGYRVIYNPTAGAGNITFIATVPEGKTECDVGQPGRVYSRRFGSGKTILASGPYKDIATGVVGVDVISTKSGISSVSTNANRSRTNASNLANFNKNPGAGSAKVLRKTWRTITKE